MAPIWFITGASSGFGLLLSLRALAAGHRVIATLRSATRSADAVAAIEAKGGKVIELDVTKAEDITRVAGEALAVYGHIDILVNNAGYSLLGAVEDLKEDEVAHQFNTNFFGPLRLIQALLPSMRARKSGTIVNVSSIAGQDAQPSCGLYAASKFALEGLSESLSKELAPFGISTLIVEPGAFRTNFLVAAQKNEDGLSDAYQGGPVGVALGKFDTMEGKQKGDPAKAVDRIFEVITGEGVAGGLKGKILRLPLGPDCLARMEGKLQSVSDDIEACRDVAMGTNYDGP